MSTADEFRATILGLRYRFVAAEGLIDRYGSQGECEPRTAKNKTIRYDPSLDFWKTMDVLGHEAHHAAFPTTSEEAVDRFHCDLVKIQRRVADGRWVVLTQGEYDKLMERADGRVDNARDDAAAGAEERGKDMGGDR